MGVVGLEGKGGVYYNRAVCYQYLGKNKEALCNYGIVLLLEKELNQRVGGARGGGGSLIRG